MEVHSYNMSPEESVAIKFAESLYELRSLMRSNKKKRKPEESLNSVAEWLAEMFRGPGEDDQTDISLLEELVAKTKTLLAVKTDLDEDEEIIDVETASTTQEKV